MLGEYSFYMWTALFFAIFLCELFYPFQKKLAFCAMLSCVATIFLCEYEKSLFLSCLFFIVFSFFVHLIILFLPFFGKKEAKAVEVITLCDIPTKEYGYVYFFGKRYRIKNNSEKTIKKGVVLQIERQEMF